MAFIVTKINLETSSISNSWANHCFAFSRDIFGGHVVSIIHANSITCQKIEAKKDPFYLTILKIIACIILIPFGCLFRLLSFTNNSDVQQALSHALKKDPPSSQNREEGFENCNNSKPSTQSPLGQDHTPKIAKAEMSDIEFKFSQNHSKAPNSLLKLSEVCINSKTSTQEIRDLLRQGCAPTSNHLLDLIANNRFDLLSCFINSQITITKPQHVIAIIKACLQEGKSISLAKNLISNPQYSCHINPEEVDEFLFRSAQKAQSSEICQALCKIKPSLALNEFYLKQSTSEQGSSSDSFGNID